MDSQAKQSYIREKANENLQTSDASKILWSRHAIATLIDDNLDRIEVETALQQSEVIEDYPLTHRPLPDFWFWLLCLLADPFMWLLRSISLMSESSL